jgi:ribosomal protein S18 acetylase RimI-like enzyme
LELGVTAEVAVEKISKLSKRALSELCDAASEAIRDGAGFGWLRPPPAQDFERYWRGVVLVPERALFVGRLDGVIGGSVQLVSPPPQKEAWAFACLIDTHFVAPWARGHGMARALLEHIEEEARAQGFDVMNLSVRVSQSAALNLYEALGFKRWGTHPKYAVVDGSSVAGHYYCKEL